MCVCVCVYIYMCLFIIYSTKNRVENNINDNFIWCSNIAYTHKYLSLRMYISAAEVKWVANVSL